MTKDQRREAAREAARVAREKAKKQERLRRWLIPTSVTVAIIAIATVVTLVIVNSQPAPQSEAGPANMISDGIVLVGEDGEMVPVETDAIPAGGEPTPTEPSDDTINIVQYVDFSCPACQAFELTNSPYIEELVSSGEATLEVHPIAILTRGQFTTNYSERANNVGACVANYAPESFYPVMQAMYVNQPQEGTAGLNDRELVEIVKGAGLDDEDVDACIDGLTFEPWLLSATDRALSGPLPNTEHPRVGGTPTVLVNGVLFEGNIGDAAAFQAFVEEQAAAA
jgi:protein-disulfide isomerase